MFDPYNPAHLEPFEALDDSARETFVGRLREQFTVHAAARLLADGIDSESLGLVDPPIPAGPADLWRIEFTSGAWKDWRFLVEAVRSGYPAELASGLAMLRATSLPTSECVQLRRDGFLIRRGKLRWVFRRDSARSVIVVHAIARRTHNPLRKIWRYFSQFKALSLLESSSLYLSRLDTLAERPGGDPFEGTPTAPMAAGFTAMLADYFGAAQPDFLRRYDHSRRSTYACCWHVAEHEALQMWQGYCCARPSPDAPPVPGGFALQTTERRLQHQHLVFLDAGPQPGVLHFLRDITYVDHATHEASDAVGEELFLKAKWFADEKEIRLGVRRLDCAFAGTVEQIEARLSALERSILLGVDLDALTESIVLNPAASNADRTALTAAIAQHRPFLSNRVRPSMIESRPVDVRRGN